MGEDEDTFEVNLEEGLQKYEDSGTRALERLANAGLDIMSDRPKTRSGTFFDGRLPSGVNDLNLGELAELLGYMTEYSDYVSGLLVMAKSEKMNADSQLQLVQAKLRKRKKGNDKERADATIVDVRYNEYSSKYNESHMYFDLLEALSSAAALNIRVLSRLVEVKRLQIEQGGRAGNVANGGRDRFKRE